MKQACLCKPRNLSVIETWLPIAQSYPSDSQTDKTQGKDTYILHEVSRKVIIVIGIVMTRTN